MKKTPTKQTLALAEALKRRGVTFELEHWDGHKHVDMYIPMAKIYIEIDGPLHDLRPTQVVSDFNRDYFSSKEGFFTKHITNKEIEEHLEAIANAIEVVVKRAADKMGDHLHENNNNRLTFV